MVCPLNNLLHEAAKAGTIYQIQELITQQKHNPNQLHTELGIPPLALAAQGGHLEAMKELLRLGADLHYDPKDKPSLWHFALQTPKALEIFDFLEEEGLSFPRHELYLDDEEKTLLSKMVSYERWDIILKIINRFSDVRIINSAPEQGPNKGATLMWQAAYKSKWDVIEAILNKFPDANHNAIPEAKLHEGTSVLNILAPMLVLLKKWNILFSIMESRKLADIDLKCFLDTQEDDDPFLVLLLQEEDKTLIERFMYNFLLRSFLLTNDSKLFTRETLCVFLKQQKHDLMRRLGDSYLPTYEEIEDLSRLMKQFNAHLMQLFDNMESLWRDGKLIFLLPDELRLELTEHLFHHAAFINLEKSMKSQLINLFIDSHRQQLVFEEPSIDQAKEYCDKLARLVFRAWRQEHFNFFMKHPISRSTAKDAYELLSECLFTNLLRNEALPRLNCANQSFVPPLLLKQIIGKIASLDEKEFYKSRLESLIKGEVVAYCHIYGKKSKCDDLSLKTKEQNDELKSKKMTDDHEEKGAGTINQMQFSRGG